MTPGPYIVKVKPKHSQACEDAAFNHHAATGGDLDCTCSAGDGYSYRKAFATLEDVAREVNRIVRAVECPRTAALHANAVGEGKCRFELLGGDVIEVEATTFGDLILARTGAPVTRDEMPRSEARTAILAVWNAEHGIGIGDAHAKPRTTVTVQEHRGRWGYVIDEPGEPLYVSHYRWGTPERAQAAGEADAGIGIGEGR